jgi:RimJ/RimL family protein N-acetyltransferase
MSVDPATLEIPEEIRSKRLRLRAPHSGFAADMNQAIRESIDELRPWMDWAQEVPTLEQSREQQLRAREAFLAHEDLQLVLFRGDRLVGSSGLHRIDWSVPKFEIGYWVRTPDARQGYISEAVATIARFAFESLSARRVEIRSSVQNRRSRAVPERLNFELEGILRNDSREPHGELRDTAVYAQVR